MPPTRWVDSDGSGSISVVEFTRAVSHGPKCHLRDKPGAVMKLFAALDEDGSGELEEDEVRHGWLLAVPCTIRVTNVCVCVVRQFVDAVTARLQDEIVRDWVRAMVAMMGMGMSIPAATDAGGDAEAQAVALLHQRQASAK